MADDELPHRSPQGARTTMAALAGSEDVFATFFEEAPIGLALADLSGRYVRINVTFAALLGQAPEDLVGVAADSLVHPEDRDHDSLRLSLLLSGQQKSLYGEERYVSPEGRTSWVLRGMTVVPDAAGRPAWLAVTAQDVTERRRAEAALHKLTATLSEQVIRDPLTGLANRALLEERLTAALARAKRNGETTAVLFLDLDRFKAVNDDFGHAIGDDVLCGVAERLQRVLRPSDTIARLGGDEFVVLAEGTAEAHLEALVNRIRAAVEVPLQVGINVVVVGVSIGVALSHAGAGDPRSLLELSDHRMYDAKRANRSGPESQPGE